MWPFRPRATTADLGIDLGTATTRVVVRGQGVVADLPTVVALRDSVEGRQVVAVGDEARRMLGRAPADTRVVQPVRGGVIDDVDATERLLRHAITLTGLKRPRLLLAMPGDTTEMGRRALEASARAAGARDVQLVDTMLAAGLGAQLPVERPTGSMVVTIGAGRTEAAVLSISGIVARRALEVAGEAMDSAIIQWLRRHHHLMIGRPSAEKVKLEVGAAIPPDRLVQTRIRGRDLSTGAPATFDMAGVQVAEALQEPVGRIRDAVLGVLRETPPELSADLLASGVFLVGGGGRLRGLDEVLGEATGMPFLQADRPEHCVADGLARLLGDPELSTVVASAP